MADEDQSAHQFSHRDASIQADSEERLDNEMQASMREGRGAGQSVGSPSVRSYTAKSTTSMVLLSTKSPRRTAAGNLREKDMLFKAPTSRNEIAIQTDQGFSERKPPTSLKAVRIESAE